METCSLSGVKDTHPPEYSGVIKIKNKDKKTQPKENLNHFIKILSDRKNKINKLKMIGITKCTNVLTSNILFPPKHFITLFSQGPI